MIVIEPRETSKTQLRIAKGVAEVRGNEPFRLFALKFAKAAQDLTKNMIFATASRSPLAMTEVKGDLVRVIAKCLNIGDTATSTSEPTEEDGTDERVKGEPIKIEGISEG